MDDQEPEDPLSLIISAEEEAAAEEEEEPVPPGGEDGITNGHGDGEGDDEGLATPTCSPHTSYWSITECPDSPFLLSPAPGPSPRKSRLERASRPGLSRIPGRDHRRYYHEHWRTEYLMDFDPHRQGMICMVCGSSLATLKLSTIKRHIRQKHPDSLLWSGADKEVIRSGWENHLSLEGGRAASCAGGADGEREDDAGRPAGKPAAETPESGSGRATPSPPAPDPAAPSARTLERYLNDSLHAWFRQEFLMEYQADAGRLVCMVCGNPLPSLHLDHIKSHVLDVHPSSLVYSSEEKHCILQSWARTHESDPLNDLLTAFPGTKDTGDGFVEFFPREADGLSGQGSQTHTEASVPEEAGTSEDAKASPSRHRARRKKSLKGGFPWRLRMDYLVAYGPDGCGCFCMVCSQALPVAKVAGFRRHIQDCHPKTTGLSRREREEVAEAWVRDVQLGGREDQMLPAPDDVARIPDETSVPAPQAKATRPVEVKKEDGLRTKGAAEEGTALAGEATAGRHGHYPGKDQRRNYQVRWRMEYLMDYDCRRHGLICMVCGATLATLKVSTIKRHIQQVHPHSLAYGPEEKQQALEGYNQTALHFVHSEDCFSAQDPGHGPRAGTAAGHASLFVP